MTLTVEAEIVPLEQDKDGIIWVGATRISLETVIAAFNEGETAEEIAYQYPALSLADIYSVIGYYLRKREEIDAYIQERKTVSAQIQEENEIRFSPLDLRKRLMTRC